MTLFTGQVTRITTAFVTSIRNSTANVPTDKKPIVFSSKTLVLTKWAIPIMCKSRPWRNEVFLGERLRFSSSVAVWHIARTTNSWGSVIGRFCTHWCHTGHSRTTQASNQKAVQTTLSKVTKSREPGQKIARAIWMKSRTVSTWAFRKRKAEKKERKKGKK